MAIIKPKRAVGGGKKLSKRELYATVCYFFPQYKLTDVEAMAYRDVLLLVKTAQKQQASYFYNMTLIAQAPPSKNQSNVKKLTDHFKKIAEIR